ncbi:helix-turn-helix domain-containing protein [Amycolatopsis thailandensis]|nr:helix-turn-helix transcriptional regulator [Amycolatopsis thailandensis]
MSESPMDALLQAAKSDVGRRLRYARTNHPNGLLQNQSALSEATGVSRRTLAEIEAGSANPNLETLIKITCGLGINTLAYLFDEQVFDQVNKQWESVEDTAEARRELGVTSVAYRADPDADVSSVDINGVLQQLGLWVAAKQAGTPDGSSRS